MMHGQKNINSVRKMNHTQSQIQK